MNNGAIINEFLQRGYITSSKLRALVRKFLEAHEVNGCKISDWYDVPAIFPGIMRDVKKFCHYTTVGNGKGKRYFYDKQEVLDYLTRLDW